MVTVASDVPLAPLTTLGIGGPARFFAEFSGSSQAADLLRFAHNEGLKTWLFGGGSNVIVADAGLDGLVLRPRCPPDSDGITIDRRGKFATVTASAGVVWDDLVARTVAENLAGLECLSGIPGLCGAAPMQNIGAYGQQLSDVLVRAEVLDTRTLDVRDWSAEDCSFGYRDSALKQAPAGSLLVTRITLTLRSGAGPTITYPDLRKTIGEGANLSQAREAVIAIRATKGMVVDARDPASRSAGSFFVNPIVSQEAANAVADRLNTDSIPGRPSAMPSWPHGDDVKLSAAWLIERCGMRKGYGDGRVGLSPKHTLALINRGGATAVELLAFAAHVQDRVRSTTGVELAREPRILG